MNLDCREYRNTLLKKVNRSEANKLPKTHSVLDSVVQNQYHSDLMKWAILCQKSSHKNEESP